MHALTHTLMHARTHTQQSMHICAPPACLLPRVCQCLHARLDGVHRVHGHVLANARHCARHHVLHRQAGRWAPQRCRWGTRWRQGPLPRGGQHRWHCSLQAAAAGFNRCPAPNRQTSKRGPGIEGAHPVKSQAIVRCRVVCWHVQAAGGARVSHYGGRPTAAFHVEDVCWHFKQRCCHLPSLCCTSSAPPAPGGSKPGSSGGKPGSGGSGQWHRASPRNFLMPLHLCSGDYSEDRSRDGPQTDQV